LDFTGGVQLVFVIQSPGALGLSSE
jgi:hypothetical protein